MRFTDLHPEALLEKEARGALDDRDRAQLDRHLESCEICRFERQVRQDFARELAAPEPALMAARFADLLAKAKVPAPSTLGASVRARVGATVTWLMGAAVVCGAGASMGAGLTGRMMSRFESSAPTSTTARTSTSADPERAARSYEPPPRASQAPSDGATASSSSEAARASPRARALVPAAESSAASLFGAESRARRQGDYAQALFLQGQLESRFGLSMEAQVSRAVMGRALLDRGRADDALACFDRYLASGSGELGEEVMAGRATALERLDRKDDARAAWQRLREKYPATPYASRVTAHLENAL